MLKFCKVCKNRGVDMKRGMICKLTERMLAARFETQISLMFRMTADADSWQSFGCLFSWRHFNYGTSCRSRSAALRSHASLASCGQFSGKSLYGWKLKTKFSIQYSLSAVHNVRKFSNFVDAG